MSLMMRPVQETWFGSTDLFIEHDAVCYLTEELARRAGCSYTNNEYGDMTSVWFEDGAKVLDYIETSPEFNAASLAASLEDWVENIPQGELESLLSNMRNMAPEWRKAIGREGELFFYVDAC